MISRKTPGKHYLLVRSRKERPTFDQLKLTQWMASVITVALDLSETERMHKLKYLTNLLEESTKACHTVVLTDMEHDKLSWELDRCRRQHAQRHDAPAQKQNFQVKKQKVLLSSQN